MSVENSSLDGVQILSTIVSLKKPWIYSDSEFSLMNTLLKCIGGIISSDVYQTYSEYIYGFAVESYEIKFLDLTR